MKGVCELSREPPHHSSVVLCFHFGHHVRAGHLCDVNSYFWFVSALLDPFDFEIPIEATVVPGRGGVFFTLG